MIRILTGVLLIMVLNCQVLAQTNSALNMSEALAYNARFNPADTRQAEVIKNIKFSYLIANLKTDNDKIAFWVNVYNSFMLTFLRDTVYEGVYTNFYKLKNVTIAGKTFSLFDIEHEFIRLGKKDKRLGFKKSTINKDTIWRKLRPATYNYKAIFIMYRGLYGYPPFQIIEKGNIEDAYLNVKNNYTLNYDWIKLYGQETTEYVKTPFAVHIKNFYPKYEGIKFKEEEINPWLK